jgi:hypothetical protein
MSRNPVQIAVLRAALRCARHRRAISREALLVRVDCTSAELDVALAELAQRGLVHGARDARLTLAGLAVAVATIPPLRATRPAQRARAA